MEPDRRDIPARTTPRRKPSRDCIPPRAQRRSPAQRRNGRRSTSDRHTARRTRSVVEGKRFGTSHRCRPPKDYTERRTLRSDPHPWRSPRSQRRTPSRPAGKPRRTIRPLLPPGGRLDHNPRWRRRRCRSIRNASFPQQSWSTLRTVRRAIDLANVYHATAPRTFAFMNDAQSDRTLVGTGDMNGVPEPALAYLES